MICGPTFGTELIAAGLGGLPLVWRIGGEVTGRELLTAQQQALLDSVVAAHNPETQAPAMIDLATLQARIELEGAWDTYVNYMFGAPTRRNAFLRIVMIGRPISNNGSPIRTSLTGAGLSAAQIDRILAPPTV